MTEFIELTVFESGDKVLLPVRLITGVVEDEDGTFIETGIDGVWTTADDMSGVKVFTLSGTQVDTPAKGQVNILKYPDGTVKKVFVK